MTDETKERLMTAWKARAARLYGEPYDVKLARNILHQNLRREVQDVVDYVNGLPLPSEYGHLVLGQAFPDDLVRWTGSVGATGVCSYDDMDGGAGRWFWAFPALYVVTSGPFTNPISALIAMVEKLEIQVVV